MNLIIETGRLRHKPEKVVGEQPAALLEMEFGELTRVEGPLTYNLTVQRVSNELLVQGKLEINLKCRCARCCDYFIKKIIIPDFNRSFALTSKSELINLTADVHEDIVLALPMVAVCSDACRGLCIGCGVNLNREQCKCKRQGKTTGWQILDNLRLH